MDAHGTEQDEDGNGFADIGKSHHEGIGISHPVKTHHFHLAGNGRKTGEISVSGDLGVPRLRLDVHGIESLLLLGNKNLLRAFHYEIAALVLGAFAGLA